MKEMNQNSKNFDITEEKSIKSTKIILRNVEINQESYETKMLSEENIEGVIKPQITFEGEKRVLVFDVRNTISLEEYLKNNHLRKMDICDIVTSVDDVLMSIENYLISENSISLDPRLIRVSSVNNKLNLKFIVIPNQCSDFSYELSKLLIRVLRFIDVDDKEALNLAYGLFVRSSKENYLISDLMELIDRVKVKNVNDETSCDNDEFKMYDDMLDCVVDNDMANEEEIDYLAEEELIDDSIVTKHTKAQKELEIDDETKEFLEDEIYEDFDKEDKKIIKFNRDNKRSRKKRKLNAHISMDYICSFFAPIVLIVVPTVYFVINGKELFMKNVAIIFIYELIVIALLIANKIRNSRMKSV